jgi:hypothetical protein
MARNATNMLPAESGKDNESPTGSGPSSRGYAPGMTQPVTAGAGPEVGAARVRFRVPDPEAALEEVRLYQEVQRPRVGPAFTRDEAAATWALDFPRPAVDRMEYQLALRYPGAPQVLLADPANPLRADGPFGEKSVIEFPGYRPPAWLAAARPATPIDRGTTPAAPRTPPAFQGLAEQLELGRLAGPLDPLEGDQAARVTHRRTPASDADQLGHPDLGAALGAGGGVRVLVGGEQAAAARAGLGQRRLP